MIPDAPLERRRLLVRGVVQGVGFRPFVYSLAARHGLTGLVGNDNTGVFIEIQGSTTCLAGFEADLRAEAPPLSRIESVETEDLPACQESGFRIVASERQAGAAPLVMADVATCADCRRELLDPADRRYRYPFVNCTNCGPRFTIVRDVPYDRAATTMSRFAMCPECAREYRDPANRRFHAEPVACPACGPAVWFEAGGAPVRGEAAIQEARARLARGDIIAVKGLGGFHLACDAASDDALGRLRTRKGRVDKPFALMVRDLETARKICACDGSEAALLSGRVRPIVLLRRLDPPRIPLSHRIAPGNNYLGVMLPYTPLHELLLGEGPLVMTSGNLSDEPIARENEEARGRLAPLADGFLLHDRDIEVVCDDSVVRVFRGRELPIRRSRGYAPLPVSLPVPLSPVLAVGGELKATFCLTREPYAYMSQHIGDMENLETLAAFERAVRHFETLLRVRPERIVCDLHPGYLSTRWAEERAGAEGLPLIRVQHHHAHVASLMAEAGLDGSRPVIGVTFDGTGYGSDGAIWGGEVLLAGYRSFRRFAHLKYLPLPGGDASIRRPYRVALAHLWQAGEAWDPALACVAACPPQEQRVLRRQMETGFRSVPTSSMGRLFDAVAALLGVRQTITYEAQAAIEMESMAETSSDGAAAYEFDWSGQDPVVFDPGPLLRAVLADLRAGAPVGSIARRLHTSVARLILELARRARDASGADTVALTGGVFQNMLLLRLAEQWLREEGFRVLIHQAVPPNDAGLALGQAVIGGLGGGRPD